MIFKITFSIIDQSTTRLPPGFNLETRKVTFGDIDGDEDLDIFISGYYSNNDFLSGSKLYLNDGAGNFSEKTDANLETDSRVAGAFADLDGDNDPDLVTTGYDASFNPVASVFFNPPKSL